jgi:hypothetical protein
MLLTRSGFDVCDTSLLSNHPKRPSADCFVRGAHHRRCAREGLTELMMPYLQGKLQAFHGSGAVSTLSAPLRSRRLCGAESQAKFPRRRRERR